MPTEEQKKAAGEKLLAAWKGVMGESASEFSCGFMYDAFDGLWLYAHCVNRELSDSLAFLMCRKAGLSLEEIKKLLPIAADAFLKHASGSVATAINEIGTVCVTEKAINPATGGQYMMALEVTAPDAVDVNERVTAKLTLNRGIVERQLIEKGRFSQWAKNELEPIIQGALSLIKEKERRTYKNVLSILQGIYGDNAPESPEALRKILQRAGVDWKKIKADIR